MHVVLLVDFGSTHTKVLAVDLDREEVVGRSQAMTTVDEDITIGLNDALERLFSQSTVTEADIVARYASSSAAGGLRMAAIGLVPSLTLEAARRAALGAGAKVVWSSGYELDEASLDEMRSAACDIILLSGGTDGGDRKTIVANARRIAQSDIAAPVIVAGNRVAASAVRQILADAGKVSYQVENVLPLLDRLNVEPAQELIRDLFIRQITAAKGLNRAQEYIGDIVMPTPKATLQAATLLADGTADEPGIGPLLVVEVGGATINIHSVADGLPADRKTVLRGLPETRTKRTVEGDLGIRYNAPTILEFVGAARLLEKLRSVLPDASIEAGELEQRVHALSTDVGHVPRNDVDDAIDRVLAASAVAFAVERHAGTLRQEFTLAGDVKVQVGKDLTQVQNLVGTGGIFKYGRWPGEVLASALYDAAVPWSLKPMKPAAWIDQEYLLYGIGLLAEHSPEKALRIAKKYLRRVALDATAAASAA